MASANHLLMVFLAVEMASVPSYVLAGLLKGRRKSSEASLKYAIYGAGAAGVMLYGISLLAGITGTFHLPSIARWLDSAVLDPQTATVLILAGLMILVGLAFKLSAVPFHFWCPDVFEGATAEVDALLSVASKAAALALLVRVSTAVAGIAGDSSDPAPDRLAAPRAAIVRSVSLVDPPSSEEMPPIQTADAAEQRATASSLMGRYLVLLLSLLAAVTCTFGNLAAYGQSNIKRLLAYSTIAHAGYMIMPVAAAVALAGAGSSGAERAGARSALAALAFYTAVYLFMNLTAFAVVAFLRHAGVREEVDEYAGLIRSHPVLVICFALALISLIGIPPMAGFVAKFFVFAALADAGGPLMIGLMLIAGVNTAISLVYYLRVIKVMTIEGEPDDRGPVVLSVVPVTYTLAIALPLIVLGIFFSQLHDWAEKAASGMFL
jgi:NADH-quinone oxidoreductase subunit N